MTTLARSQQEFFDAVFSGGEHAHATYRRNAFANWHGALAAAYPVVQRLVGDAFFREAARRFGMEHPSPSGDLNLYGATFPDFLAAYAFARELPYLADVARLEWACHESFHAADAVPFDPAALAVIPPERHGALRFRLHPAVRLVSSAFPVMAIWEANQDDRDGTPDGAGGAEHVLVRRDGPAVRLRRLSAPQWAFLEALAQGESLDRAVDLAAVAGDAAFVAPFMARLGADGVLTGFAECEGGA